MRRQQQARRLRTQTSTPSCFGAPCIRQCHRRSRGACFVLIFFRKTVRFDLASFVEELHFVGALWSSFFFATRVSESYVDLEIKMQLFVWEDTLKRYPCIWTGACTGFLKRRIQQLFHGTRYVKRIVWSWRAFCLVTFSNVCMHAVAHSSRLFFTYTAALQDGASFRVNDAALFSSEILPKCVRFAGRFFKSRLFPACLSLQ